MSDIYWEKRARELVSAKGKDARNFEWVPAPAVEAMLKLGHEMADARAEEIAARCEGVAASIARAFISKPKTREQVLEEALRRIADDAMKDNVFGDGKREIARQALEWKP